MAASPYTGVTTTEPQASPTPYQNLQPPTATPAMYGGQVAEGLKELGTGAGRAAVFFGEAAADNAANQYQERLNEIMHGTPGKMVQGPDGQMVPDTGFMGLKGRAAMDARPDVDKRLEQLRAEIRGGLLTPQQSLRFDDFSRRYKTWAEGRIGQHTDNESNRWYDQVENATANAAQKHIAVNYNDPAAVEEGQHRLREAYVKKAQRNGGGPELVQAAMDKADRETAATLMMATAVTDPLKAQRIAEKSRMALGTMYDEVMNRIRPRAEQAEGQRAADAKLIGGEYDNNSANIVRSNFNYAGGKGAPHGAFETFQTPEHGTAAAYITMRAKARDNGGQISFLDLIGGNSRVKGWAAKDDGKDPMLKGNDPAAYAKVLADSVGMKPGDNIPLGDADKMATILKAQNKLEKGRQTVPDEAFKNGIVLASGGQLATQPQRQYKTQIELLQEGETMFADKPHALQAYNARINQSFRLRNAEETRRKAEFEGQMKDSIAEAMATGVTANPKTEEEFLRHYGPEKAPTLYGQYQNNLKFASEWNGIKDMPDAAQDQQLVAIEPKPGTPGFADAQARHDHLKKEVRELQDHRAADPAGAVDDNPAVKAAMRQFDPSKPATFAPVIEARIAAQDNLQIPYELQSGISEHEAKGYAAMLKPVVGPNADPDEQKRVIDRVVGEVGKKYGEYSKQAMTRVLSHVTAKKDAAEVLASALTRLAEGSTEPPVTPQDAAKVQVERDADRAARIAGAPKIAGQYLDAAPLSPDSSNINTTEGVKEAVTQAGRPQQRPFWQAQDLLRSNPGLYIEPYIKRFGIAKVPPDMLRFVPVEKTEAR